jgi:phage N-6-adenine-methyltransferase
VSNDEWRTPKTFFKNLDKHVGGFDVDLCADTDNHLVDKYYTLDDSCLKHDWKGKCFCNPPYSDIIPFLKHAIGEVYGIDNCELWFLIPGNFEQYYHDLILSFDFLVEAIYFIKGRISFLDDNNKTVGSPRFSNILVHYKFGYDPIKFYTCDRDFTNIQKVS